MLARPFRGFAKACDYPTMGRDILDVAWTDVDRRNGVGAVTPALLHIVRMTKPFGVILPPASFETAYPVHLVSNSCNSLSTESGMTLPAFCKYRRLARASAKQEIF